MSTRTHTRICCLLFIISVFECIVAKFTSICRLTFDISNRRIFYWIKNGSLRKLSSVSSAMFFSCVFISWQWKTRLTHYLKTSEYQPQESFELFLSVTFFIFFLLLVDTFRRHVENKYQNWYYSSLFRHLLCTNIQISYRIKVNK